MSYRCLCAVALASAAGLALPALGQTGGRGEAPDQPPARRGPVASTRPGAGGGADSAAFFQVNVDGQGLNISGDAANEPSIAVDPTAPNRMAIGWRQFDAIASNFRQAGNAWSNDGGRTWHNQTPLTAGLFRSDPVLAAGADGRMYYYSLGPNNFACDLFVSDDGGDTWVGPTPAFGGDKAWLTIDNSGGMGDGHLYASWSTCCGSFNTTTFTRSINGGASFQTPIALTGTPLWGTLAVGPEGELYIVGRNGFGTGFRVLRSDNAQNPAVTPTFSSSSPNMGGTFPSFAGPNPGGLVTQMWIDVDRTDGPRRGHVYVLSGIDPDGSDPLDLHFIRSTDKGQTWSAPVRVNDGPSGASHWEWHPTMSVAPSGRIDVIWNDTSNGGGAVNKSELFYSFSNDGGVTWSPSEKISDQWDSFVGWPNQNKIGDYYHMVSDLVGADLAYAATFTGGQDVYYVRIGDRDCNGNGVGDTQDLATGAAEDCDADGIPDTCEIAAGAEADENSNGVPDACEQCYPDCDTSTGVGTLDFFDFICFQDRFAAADPYACDCDTSTGPATCDFFDFICFQDAFSEGCS